MIDELGDRMKQYEATFDMTLPKRSPVMVRLDGRSFHTLTRKMNLQKPIDLEFRNVMANVATKLCQEMMNAKLAYLQSDEITILMVDYPETDKDCWFDNRVQKIASVAASTASSRFTKLTGEECSFDARVYIMPPNDVCNALIWRQQDATRNSINALAQSLFPSKQLQGLDLKETMDKMWKEKGVNWNDCTTQFKRGSVIRKMPSKKVTVKGTFDVQSWKEDKEIPIFTEDRYFIERFIPELQDAKKDLKLWLKTPEGQEQVKVFMEIDKGAKPSS